MSSGLMSSVRLTGGIGVIEGRWPEYLRFTCESGKIPMISSDHFSSHLSVDSHTLRIKEADP